MITVTVGTSAVVGVIAGGIVAGVGGVAALGGTGTVVGTAIANKCHNESLLKRAQQAIDDYKQYRDKIVEVWQKIESMCHAISIKVILFGTEPILNFLWHIFMNFNPSTNDHKTIAKSLLGLATSKIKITLCLGSVASSIASLGLFYNVYEQVLSAKVIHKKEPHPAAVEIQNKAMVELNYEMERLQIIMVSWKRKV